MTQWEIYEIDEKSARDLFALYGYFLLHSELKSIRLLAIIEAKTIMEAVASAKSTYPELILRVKGKHLSYFDTTLL